MSNPIFKATHRRRRLIAIASAVVVCFLGARYSDDIFFYLYLRNLQPTEGQSAATRLSDGSTITFVNRTLPRIMIGPADEEMILRWMPTNGATKEWQVRAGGSSEDYSGIELRTNPNESVVWLVDTNSKVVFASLDFKTGICNAPYSWGQDGSENIPKWATLKGGKKLIRLEVG